MSQTTLVVSTGRDHGSPAARRLRTEGNIPAVLYGHGMTPISLSVERRDLRQALSGPAGANTVLQLHVDGKNYPAVIKELQRHPVRRTVSHIDFLQVNMNEEITVHVPLRLEGEAKAVLAEGGIVDPSVDTIEVRTTPNNMPSEFVVDITDMKPGEVIRLSDLTLPKGVVPSGEPDMAIVTILATSRVDEPAAAEADAAAPAAEGDAAPAPE